MVCSSELIILEDLARGNESIGQALRITVQPWLQRLSEHLYSCVAAVGPPCYCASFAMEHTVKPRTKEKPFLFFLICPGLCHRDVEIKSHEKQTNKKTKNQKIQHSYKLSLDFIN